jgi:hypothetical protein
MASIHIGDGGHERHGFLRTSCIRRREQPVIGVGTGLEANSLLPRRGSSLGNLSKYIWNVVMTGSSDVRCYDCELSVSRAAEHYFQSSGALLNSQECARPLSHNRRISLRWHANVKLLKKIISHITRSNQNFFYVCYLRTQLQQKGSLHDANFCKV